MRQDAKDLLERLNRRDFNYQQFADPFADMELWPIFEALLTDERVVGRATGVGEAEVQIRRRGAAADPARAPAAPPATSSDGGLFSRYVRHPAPHAPSGDVVNLRQFLAGLADNR
ncbi:MAG: hypothetical protein ABW128_07965 [Rhizorhabdus sp.]